MAEKNNETTIIFGEHEVVCYGTLEEDSNFSVICDDEWADDVWCNGHPVTGEPFTSWREVVESLWDCFDSPLVEISAV